MIKKYFPIATLLLSAAQSYSQTDSKPEKVSHAEPLYYDLVRDLGARKGEKEFNAAFDFSKHKNYNEHAFLVEYEFAPINRVGFEVEADFSFFDRTASESEIPGSKLESLRFSSQYSFFISSKLKTTLAVGYTQIIEFNEFENMDKELFVTGIVYNPFFVAAKRWGSYINTLIYAYPMFEHDFTTNKLDVEWQINSSLLFTIPGTKHFAGVELNKEFEHGAFEMSIRPQVKFKLNKHTAIGLVAGIPVKKSDESFSSFLRIIYEP
ncbi:MAG: HAEPLYID family protein [Flavobacterium sp.]|uniref:HAEPLYID family protein n=1 Tax=Flavobacterium sp. TaxID=239 RepID=UPI002FCA8F6F